MGDTMYIRLCEGLNDKGTLIPTNEDIYKYVKNSKHDYYVSVYEYNESQRAKIQETGTVSGITDVSTTRLVFDFDSDNVEQARKDTVNLVERLKGLGIDPNDANIYYSGKKGFHVVIDTDYRFTPSEQKKLASSLAKDLQTFDSVIYNASRVIRLPHTLHPNTKLFKTPISFQELSQLSVDQIKSISADEYEYVIPKKISLPKAIIAKVKNLKEEVQKKPTVDSKVAFQTLDYTKNALGLSPWKLALLEGFFPHGQRSNSFMILAATLKSKGLDKEQCYSLLKATQRKQAERYGQDPFDKKELYNNVIETVYSPSWLGKTYSEDNFPEQLQKHLTELGIPRKKDADHEEFVMDVARGFNMFHSYAKDIDENTLKFGIKALDNILRVQVGHLIGVLAGPGVGKTSLALTLLNNTSKMGVKSFFGSYDMAGSILFQKLLQRETGYGPDELFDVYRKNNEKEINRFHKLLEENYSNVSFCFKVGQSLKELRESIILEENRLNERIKLVIVDYLELIRTNASDPTQASAEAIQGLREIANEGRVVVCLLQPNKLNSKPDEPLLYYSASKGSSSIAQALTAMITANRPGYDSRKPENDKFFSINIVKNRMGTLGAADFSWDGLTGRIEDLDDNGREELKALRAVKKMEKELEKDGEWI